MWGYSILGQTCLIGIRCWPKILEEWGLDVAMCLHGLCLLPRSISNLMWFGIFTVLWYAQGKTYKTMWKTGFPWNTIKLLYLHVSTVYAFIVRFSTSMSLYLRVGHKKDASLFQACGIVKRKMWILHHVTRESDERFTYVPYMRGLPAKGMQKLYQPRIRNSHPLADRFYMIIHFCAQIG